ncbi:hypothetical protein ABEB36_015364 [Hypothenemus hampei]|uniref:Uncharacterized protein n=1 Tax=Hypothenemus hampei TaxID=57062 RepID=A0ABD1E2P7_HYPHA
MGYVLSTTALRHFQRRCECNAKYFSKKRGLDMRVEDTHVVPSTVNGHFLLALRLNQIGNGGFHGMEVEIHPSNSEQFPISKLHLDTSVVSANEQTNVPVKRENVIYSFMLLSVNEAPRLCNSNGLNQTFCPSATM